jgi:hypothetical protein
MPEEDTHPPTPTPAPLSPVLKTEEEQRLANLGDFAIKGGPGRPKGLKNKFTRIKEDMLDVWHEEGGKEKFRTMFRDKHEKAVDKIISILPREIEVDASLDEGTQGFFYKMAQKAGLIPQDNAPEANENPPA